jgi:hypothetical protein
MRHFGVEQWADVARDIHTESEIRAALLQHVGSGCRECGDSFQLWQSVATNARNEKSYTPPEDVVHQAKALSALLANRTDNSVAGELAKLVFDTFTQPITVGVRGAATSPRQLLYRAGRLAIDLRVEVKPGEVPVFLFGQILQEGHSDRGEKAVEVTLLEGSRALGRTKTNELGEFEMHIPVLPGLTLALRQHDGKDILIPLSAITARGRLNGNSH